MLGPAADELAEMWRDKVRFYRYEKQLACVSKAEIMAQDAGFIPQPVPPKILFPLLDGVSLEEDEDMHTMWVALLANASSPTFAEKVRPGYIALLREMSPDEAALLNWIYADGIRKRKKRPALTPEWFVIDLRKTHLELCKQNIERASEFDVCLAAL